MSLTGEGYSHLCSWPVFMPGFFLFHAGYLIGWVPYMAVMPQIHPSQRSQLAGFTSFVCVSCTHRPTVPVHNQTNARAQPDTDLSHLPLRASDCWPEL